MTTILRLAFLLIVVAAPTARAATDAETKRAIEEMRRLNLAAEAIDGRVERAAVLPAELLHHMREHGFPLRAVSTHDRRKSIWIIDTRAVVGGCEAYTSYLVFPADASEDAMRGYLSRINLGSFLNAPAKLAMFYPMTRAMRPDITSCVGPRPAYEAFVKGLVAAFASYVPPR